MFQEPFFILSQEGYLIRSCICTGLTEIRNANIGDKGRFYAGFFQLSIGIERLAKLALILDYMVENELSPPGERYVRKFNHNIETLFDELQKIAAKRQSATLSEFGLAEIPKEILVFLSIFARKTRYANLDGLAKGAVANEPVSEWSEVLIKILQANVRQKSIDKILAQGQALAEVISSFTMVRSFDLQNKPLSVKDWLTVPQLLYRASKYAIWEISRIIRPMIDITDELAWDAREINIKKDSSVCRIPELREFFWFLPRERSYILRKKRWP